MKRLIGAIALFVTLAVGGVFAQPASADPGATIDADSIIGCVVTLTVTVEDGGTYYLNTWDDGTFLAGQAFEATTGETVEVSFTIMAVVLQGAAGLGVYIENDLGAAATETFASLGAYTGADAVSQACADSGGTDSGAPPGAILNAVLTVGCGLTADVTSTGLGDYTAVLLVGEEVIDEQDFTGTAGQRQDVNLDMPLPTPGELTVEIRDAETGDVYATDSVASVCVEAETTTTTAAPTTTAAAAAAVVTPRFTG